MGFGIVAFSTLAVTGFYFITFYASADVGNKCHCYCIPCKDITPIKRVILFYLVFSPFIIISFFFFYFNIIKK